MADTQRLNETDDNHNVQTAMDVQFEAQKRKKYIYGGIALILTIVLIIIIIVATTSGSSSGGGSSTSNTWPVVVATWNRLQVANMTWLTMMASPNPHKSLDGVVSGIQWCQTYCNPGQANVDSDGKVTQSAMVIYGPTMDTGAVAELYDIDDAVNVAKHVLIYSEHALLVGYAATEFARQMGLGTVNFSQTTNAVQRYNAWVNGGCTQNFWRNVANGDQCLIYPTNYTLNPETSVKKMTGCDYNESSATGPSNKQQEALQGGLITGSQAVIAIDENGEMSLATSSNGLNNKIAGRVSDAAIPGAGGYIDPDVGGCTATGHGDIIIRFAPAKSAVTYMKTGSTPQEAAQLAVDEIEYWCPDKQAIVLCLSKDGTPGIAYNAQTAPQNYAYKSAKCNAPVQANDTHPRGTCV